MSKLQLRNLNWLTWWLPLFLGGCITAASMWVVNYQNQNEIHKHLGTLVEQADKLIKKRFYFFEYGLRGTKGAISAVGVDSITRQQFINYINSRDIDNEFKGALGFGFIRRVSKANEQEFLRQARADGAPNFSIRTLTPHQDDRFVIQYIYPEAPNMQAVGLDIGSETNRRNAALAAARENRPFLTEPITLVQADSKSRRGVLILLPIFADNAPIETPRQREEAVVGWSYAPLVIDDVLAGLDQVLEQATVTLSNKNEASPFYYSNEQLSSDASENVTQEIRVMGQSWIIKVSLTKKGYNKLELWSLNTVAVAGLSLTLLSVFLINLLRSTTVYDGSIMDVSIGKNSVGTYLTSSIVKRTWPPAFIGMVLLISGVAWLLLEHQVSNIREALYATTDGAVDKFNKNAEQYKQDVRFLASTNPVKSLAGLGLNKDEKVRESLYTNLTDLFSAYMMATPTVYQVRLIEVNEQGNWIEKVKVERQKEKPIVYTKENLQEKTSEPYIKSTLGLTARDIFISDINLNREHGAIEYPERPVWRFSKAIFAANGNPSGILIVNYNTETLLSDITASTSKYINLYIASNDGEFIFFPEHPSFSEKTFRSRGDYTHNYKELVWDGFNIDELNNYYDNEYGPIWEYEEKFYLDENRIIHIHCFMQQIPEVKKFISDILTFAFIILLIMLGTAILQYWLWVSSKIKQRDDWNLQLKNQREKETVRLKVLLDSSPDANLIINGQGVIQMVNSEAEHIFGLGRKELEGRFVETLYPRDSFGDYQEIIEKHTKPSNEKLLDADSRMLAYRADGSTFPVEIKLSSVQIDNDSFISASVHDITERLEFEKQLTHALEDAEKATRAKSSFLANTSHEIRTPLNAIIGLTHLLSHERLTAEQQRLLDKIHLAGKSLLSIVNDVLDLSKIEADEMMIEQSPLNFTNLLTEIVSVYSQQAEDKGLQLTFEETPDTPNWVIGDSVRIRQIIVNLLSNALKFTAKGGIALKVSISPSKITTNNRACTFCIEVSDTGIGISPEAQTHLFMPFSQADASTTRRFGGTGLGLSIVLHLVELMNGDIRLKSQEGQGTTFLVELPLVPLNEDEIELPENDIPRLFILVAEDNEADASLLTNLTQKLGWRSETVRDGLALVNVFKTRIENGYQLPDALIVDWQMPNLDGLAALNQLKALVGKEKLPAILMLSAFEKQKLHALDTQQLVDQFVQKPIDASELFNAVNDVVSAHTGDNNRVLHATTPEAVKAKWLPNLNIIVVDDSATNLEVAQYILKQNGAKPTTFTNGEDVCEYLASHHSEFDAVLMDVQMPGMDGLEATRKIRNEMFLDKLPIIALTAGALVEERNKAIEAGMNNFLTKPINPSMLVNVLRSQIEQYRGINIPVEPMDVAKVSMDSDWPLIRGVNAEQAKEMLLGNQDLFFSTLERLLNEHRSLTEINLDDLDSEEAAELRRELAERVHKLRSSSGMVGANALHQLASEAEDALIENSSSCRAIMASLSAELVALISASQQALDDWRKEQFAKTFASSEDSDTPLDKQTAMQVLHLVEEQDLDALDVVDKHLIAFKQLMGDKNFDKFYNYLSNLNFEQAKELLQPIVKALD